MQALGQQGLAKPRQGQGAWMGPGEGGVGVGGEGLAAAAASGSGARGQSHDRLLHALAAPLYPSKVTASRPTCCVFASGARPYCVCVTWLPCHCYQRLPRCAQPAANGESIPTYVPASSHWAPLTAPTTLQPDYPPFCTFALSCTLAARWSWVWVTAGECDADWRLCRHPHGELGVHLRVW